MNAKSPRSTGSSHRPLGRFRALLLDALGTLVELPPPGPALRDELAARFGVQVDEGQAAAAIAAEIAYYRRHFDAGRDPASVDALRARCAEVLRAALPRSPALTAVERPALTEALLASLRFRAYPDARPAILAARAHGLRVVVASNWDVSLADVLVRLELAPLLDGVVTSASVGARKPAQSLFAAALAAAGAAPEEALHVGDSLVEDVEGALAAGVEPVLIRRDGGPGPPGLRTIASLEELSSLT